MGKKEGLCHFYEYPMSARTPRARVPKNIIARWYSPINPRIRLNWRRGFLSRHTCSYKDISRVTDPRLSCPIR
jgi:hypothetical protein